MTPIQSTPRRQRALKSPLTAALGAALLSLSLGVAAQSTGGGGPGSGTGMGSSGSTGSGAGMGSGTATGTPQATATLDRADRRFMEKAATDGMAEVQMGTLAQQRATHPRVKEFATRMVQDHGTANTELMRLATAKGMAAPADAGREHKREADRMAKLNGPEFDRAYMKHMLDEHQEDVRDFEKASKSARDPEIKEFASRTLPTLQSHLELARSTNDALKDSR